MEIKNVELLSFKDIDIVLKNTISLYDSGTVDIEGKLYTYICVQIDFLTIPEEENFNRYDDTGYTLIDVLFHDGKAFFKELDMCIHISRFGDVEEQKAFIQKAFSQDIIKDELIPYLESFDEKAFKEPERDFFEWLKEGKFEIDRLTSAFNR